MVNGFHDQVDRGEEECAGLAFPCPKQTLLNHLFVAADRYIDAQNRPGSEGTLKLGGCGHGWDILGENIGHATYGAAYTPCPIKPGETYPGIITLNSSRPKTGIPKPVSWPRGERAPAFDEAHQA